MPIIKEYREFFLRHLPVASGTKPDQEANFPSQYYKGSVKVYNRFLKNDFPSEAVFRKLFESLTFKLNKEDTAKLTEQGLAKIATDANAASRTSSAANDFTAFVVPHQLPDVVVDNVLGDIATIATKASISITTIKRTFGSVFRRVFKVTLVGDVDNPGTDKFYGTDDTGTRGWRNTIHTQGKQSVELDNDNKIHLVNDEDNPGNLEYYGTNNLGARGYYPLPIPGTLLTTGFIVMYHGVSAPIGWAICDGQNGTPDLRGRFIVATGQNVTPAVGDLNPTYTLGNTGGENTHQLSYNELPKHSHEYPTYNDSSGAAGLTTVANGGTLAKSKNNVYSSDVAPIESTYSRHENRPPYYALMFIMKL